ncbi:tripartite motif-containing protein 10-like [Macrotis lagotis]|uniref:tripartite motif-containing protein 10-like n=1 Tax=Macrotis lagotis TaxID=92651 RepID=UPI003D68E333
MEKNDTSVREGTKADWRLSKSLQDLLTCPICRGFFSDPITEDSGSTFCRDCLPQKPQPSTIHTNWKMQNMVQVAKQLKPFLEHSCSILEGWCPKHQECLSLFCREDNEKICQVCRYSSRHQGHTLIQLPDLNPQ